MLPADPRTREPRAALAGACEWHAGHGCLGPFALPTGDEVSRRWRFYESLGRYLLLAIAAAGNVERSTPAWPYNLAVDRMALRSTSQTSWAWRTQGQTSGRTRC